MDQEEIPARLFEASPELVGNITIDAADELGSGGEVAFKLDLCAWTKVERGDFENHGAVISREWRSADE